MQTSINTYSAAHRQACLDAFKSNVPKFFTTDEINDFEKFLLKVENGLKGTSFFVIMHGNNVIGCGGFGDKENSGIVTLAWGLVHRDYHKQGFGEKLLLYRLEKIKELGLPSPVYVDTSQYAEGFFKKFGFQTKKVTPDFYGPGLHRHDMEWEYV